MSNVYNMMVFIKYGIVGIFNTCIHWLFFYIFYSIKIEQSLCNFLGYCFAVIFSYTTNAKYNFKLKINIKDFVLFFFLMGGLSLGIGSLADKLSIFPLYTLIISSILSLFLGYLLSRYLVFKVT